MTTRTKHRLVHFSRSFQLGDLDEIFAAGDYEIDEDEELIEGLSWMAYRHVGTFIHLPAVAGLQSVRFMAIDALDLETAIQKDQQVLPPDKIWIADT